MDLTEGDGVEPAANAARVKTEYQAYVNVYEHWLFEDEAAIEEEEDEKVLDRGRKLLTES